jgi:YARHG domain
MIMRKIITKIIILAALAGGASLDGFTLSALAQDAAAMSCDQLWYARNEIYARNGYCFKTERARAVFGAGCFPPYGQLRGWESERVNELQMWERRKGC